MFIFILQAGLEGGGVVRIWLRSDPALMELAGGPYKFHQLGTVKCEEVWRCNPKEIILGEESFNIFFLFINERLLKFFCEGVEDVVGWSWRFGGWFGIWSDFQVIVEVADVVVGC